MKELVQSVYSVVLKQSFSVLVFTLCTLLLTWILVKKLMNWLNNNNKNKSNKGESNESLESSHSANAWYFWNQVLQNPECIMAPMVWQSELAFRLQGYLHGCDLCFSPMIRSGKLIQDCQKFGNHKGVAKHVQNEAVLTQSMLSSSFSRDIGIITDTMTNVDSDNDSDSNDTTHLIKLVPPLIVQLCGNNGSEVLKAALLIERHVPGVVGIDLNLGCPQRCAKKEHFGSFLLDHPETLNDIFSIVNQGRCNDESCPWHIRNFNRRLYMKPPNIIGMGNTNHDHHSQQQCHRLHLPFSAKIRILNTEKQTLDLCRRLVFDWKVWFLSIHGRQRERVHWKQPADLSLISKIVSMVDGCVPIVSNGNIQRPSDVKYALQSSQADAVMSATGILSNPWIFQYYRNGKRKRMCEWVLTKEMIFHIGREYLEIASMNRPIASRCMNDHILTLCQPLWINNDRMNDWRDLVRCEERVTEVHQFRAALTLLESRVICRNSEGPCPTTQVFSISEIRKGKCWESDVMDERSDDSSMSDMTIFDTNDSSESE